MAFKVSRHQPWDADVPPEKYRIRVDLAIKAAGNANKLAKALGITRGAVTQWGPNYRNKPYLPLESAIKFLNQPELRKAYKRGLKK